MQEIEIKILDIEREKTERELLSIGAVKVFDDEIHAVYFDSAGNTIKNKKGTFRLRRQGQKTVLTFKKEIENTDAKVREEEEVEVSDFDAMMLILLSLGFSPWLEMKKHRTTYELAGLHFEFDKYHGDYEYIPEFLEIEGNDIQTIYRYADMLGFSRDRCRPWDALQVAEYYRGSAGVKD